MPVPILYVIDSFKNPHAGTEGQLYQLVQGLDRSRFSPHLLVFQDSAYLQENGFPCNYTVLGRSGLSNPLAWFALWKVAKKFRKSGGKIVHAFFIDPSIMCPIIFKPFGVHGIISRRDMGYWYTQKYLFLLRCSGRAVSSVIANSEAVKDVVSNSERIPRDEINVIYNGYEEKVERVSIPAEVSLLRKQYPDAVLGVIVANIRPLKRISDAITALATVVQRSCNLHLVVVGDGDHSGLSQTAEALDVRERVHFLGRRSDVADCLPGFDIGLLCSESEGFSNSIVEYMRAGLPVICSSVGGNSEAIEHGVSGYLYECGNIGELSDGLMKLVFDTALRHKMGSAALKASEARFNSRLMVDQHQDVYSELVR
ncbi:glycosyltransferase [Marinobacter daepoensis]|uniref:glycosyltransferase n=1 Tax=Marinobacter daepoensis TaxID=262077 RepID=UPI001C9688F3|nr:glycosyltransferase [Marinobacter daepoensis]MBY6032518.1 glycosyltransferase [Marinobacter daepoensis]